MVEVVFMGIDTEHPSDFIYGDSTHDWWLLVYTKTPAVFFLPDNKQVTAPANSMVLYPPKMFALYKACADTYKNHYIRFHTDESFVDNLPYGVPVHINAPEPGLDSLFNLVSMENWFKWQNSSQSISMLMRMLIFKMKESMADSDLSEQARALVNLRYEIRVKPDYPWSVAEMADKLHVSAGYLQSSYKKQFGVSCMQDVVYERIELAKTYLKTTEYSSLRISQLCGYQSVEHFCRQFKNSVGMSPLSYRKKMAENNE